jgi:hypothetical protein
LAAVASVAAVGVVVAGVGVAPVVLVVDVSVVLVPDVESLGGVVEAGVALAPEPEESLSELNFTPVRLATELS